MRVTEWLTRLGGNAPRLVSLGLAALIAVELARALIILLSGSPVKSPHPVSTRPMQSRNRGVDIQGLTSAHLFGVAIADPSSQDPANAPQSTANLVLAGTIASNNPKAGIAIISDGGPTKVYGVGDNVGGATLHSVFLDHVLLDRSGSLETLLLPRLLLTGTQVTPPIASINADPRTSAAIDNVRRMVQADPSVLNQVLRTVASYDNVAGKLRGFRAYPGRDRLAFNKLGLRPGDLVTAINGTPLDDPQRSQEVLNTIQSSDRATVTIERAGQKQELTLNVAQLAGEAAKELEGAASAPPPAAPNNTENLND